MHITRSDAIKEPFEQVPLIFGLVGHRNTRPEDAEPLRERIREIIREYRAKDKYPQTPVVLLTGLADGADRLGAQVALEFGRENREAAQMGGVYLVAVLPMPPEEYARDCADEKSREEFYELLKVAKAVWVMDWVDGCPVSGEGPAQECRHKQYAAAGEFIAVNSHVLIALWDGKGTHLDAGTAWVKERRDQAIRDAAKRLQQSDPCGYGPFIQIVTPRSGPGGAEGLNGPAFQRVETLPFAPQHPAHGTHGDAHGSAGADMPNHEKIYLAIEDFNQHVADMSKDASAAADATRNAGYLYPGSGEGSAQEPEELPAALRWMRRLFATADTLANRYQTDSHRHLARMILYAAIGGVALDLFHGLHGILHKDYGPIMAGLTGACFVFFAGGSALAMWYLMRTQEGRHHDCYLAYRSLAESLRVQFFWKISGVKKTVALHFEGRDFDQLDWIRSAADVAWRMAGAQLGAAGGSEYGDPETRLDRVVAHWVEDQRNYFGRALTRDKAWLHRHEEAVGLCIRGAFGMALLCAWAGAYSITGRHLPCWLAALTAAALVINAGGLLLNIFGCSSLGLKAKPGFMGRSWHKVRHQADRVLKCFAGLLEVPRWVPREAEEDRSHRIAAFRRGLIWLTVSLAVGMIAMSIIAPRATHETIHPAAAETHAVSGETETRETPEHAEDSSAEFFAEWVEFSAITSIGLLLLAAGLFHFRADRHAFEAHAESYESMFQVFTEALARLKHDRLAPNNPNAAGPDRARPSRAVLEDLGKAALGENGNWAATHHSRPLQPPIG